MFVPVTSQTLAPHPFVDYDENRLAWIAVNELVAEHDTYTPRLLFLEGSSGTGKTLLASHAVKLLHGRNPEANILYWTEAYGRAKAAKFQGAPPDLLILDNFHEWRGTKHAREVLCRAIDLVLEAGNAVLIASQLSTAELSNPGQRIVSRIRGGVVLNLPFPGSRGRKKLLKHFAKRYKVKISGDSIAHLARSLYGSPDDLRNHIEQINHELKFEDQEADSAFIDQYVDRFFRSRAPSMAEITQAVANKFETSSTQICSRSKDQVTAFSRHIAVYLSHELTSASLKQIGQFFGGRAHSTILHSVKRMSLELAEDAKLACEVRSLRQRLLKLPDLPR